MTLGTDFQKFVNDNHSRLEQMEKAEPDSVANEAIKINLELSQLGAAKINALFGADACRKIFGTETPSVSMITDFFEQAMPLIKEYAEEENARSRERVKKYTAKYQK